MSITFTIRGRTSSNGSLYDVSNIPIDYSDFNVFKQSFNEITNTITVKVDKERANEFYRSILKTRYFDISELPPFYEEFDCMYYVLHYDEGSRPVLSKWKEAGVIEYAVLYKGCIILKAIKEFVESDKFIENFSDCLQCKTMKIITKNTYLKHKRYSELLGSIPNTDEEYKESVEQAINNIHDSISNAVVEFPYNWSDD